MATPDTTDVKRALNEKAPLSIMERCGVCNKPFQTSVRAFAEGRDVCPRCIKPTGDNGPYTSLTTISTPLYQAYYTFYTAFWKWMNNRKETNEREVSNAAGMVLHYINEDPESEGMVMSLEQQEERAIYNLFESYVFWKLNKTERTWKRLFYAFWAADTVYKG